MLQRRSTTRAGDGPMPGWARSAGAAVVCVGGVGLLPRGAATAATAVGAVAINLARPRALTHALLLAAAVALGQSLSPGFVSETEPDPQRVVIDELAGIWLTFFGIPMTTGRCVAGAVVFRALDKVKPGPIGRLDRGGRGWSLMADDLAAGVIANLALRAWIGRRAAVA